jgi:hypothetical protein
MNGASDSSLDEELFIPLVYYKTHRHKDFSITPKVRFDDILISNKGRVRGRASTEVFYKPQAKNGVVHDLKVKVTSNGISHELDLLRAMASSFVPLPSEELLTKGYSLDPICINGDYSDLSIDNITWINHETEFTPPNLSITPPHWGIEEIKASTEEVFKPLSHTGLKSKSTNSFSFTTRNYWIGSKGTVWSFVNKKSPRQMLITLNEGKYPTIRVHCSKTKTVNLSFHRVLGCTFIEADPAKGLIENLHVNHMDGDKNNYELDNLEWSTVVENVDHAFKTGLSKNKPVKGTYIEGVNAGMEFLLFGGKHQKLSGFVPSKVSNVVNGIRPHHKGCVFTFATDFDVTALPRFEHLCFC